MGREGKNARREGACRDETLLGLVFWWCDDDEMHGNLDWYMLSSFM